MDFINIERLHKDHFLVQSTVGKEDMRNSKEAKTQCDINQYGVTKFEISVKYNIIEKEKENLRESESLDQIITIRTFTDKETRYKH